MSNKTNINNLFGIDIRVNTSVSESDIAAVRVPVAAHKPENSTDQCYLYQILLSWDESKNGKTLAERLDKLEFTLEIGERLRSEFVDIGVKATEGLNITRAEKQITFTLNPAQLQAHPIITEYFALRQPNIEKVLKLKVLARATDPYSRMLSSKATTSQFEVPLDYPLW
jgi:hypothetical protein